MSDIDAFFIIGPGLHAAVPLSSFLFTRSLGELIDVLNTVAIELEVRGHRHPAHELHATIAMLYADGGRRSSVTDRIE